MAFELLKEDHKKVSALFEEIEAASGDTKMGLFAQLKSELDVHAHVEEAILYPALENTSEAREITLEAYQEHQVVKDLLAQLAVAASPDEEWDAKLTVLKENVEHHVEEEEGELFSKAEAALGEEEIERLGDEMAAEKTRVMGQKPQATKRSAKSRTMTRATPKKRGTSILGALANLVGLGSKTDSATQSEKASARKTASKSAGTKKSGKKSSAKKSATAAKTASTKRGAKKAAAKGSAKRSASKTASVGRSATAQKAVRSNGARKSAASKSSSSKKTSGARQVSAKTAARKR